MPRLVVNPDSTDAWEIELRPGANRIGTSQENDFPIEHSSVSSSHCQLILSEKGAVIKDLGSTNGTRIEGELIEEGVLRPGQEFFLGDVRFRFESESGVLSAGRGLLQSKEPGSAAEVSAPAYCKFHPKTLARFACPKCRRTFCELCVNTRSESGQTRKLCRACGVSCAPLQVQPVQREDQGRSFFQRLAGAFGYPLKGDGLVLLVAGTVFYSLLDAVLFFASFAAFMGMAAVLILTVFGTGYLVAYLKRIVASSAIGELTMPDWPDFTDFASDILSPFLQFLGTALVCFGPAIAVSIFVSAGTPWDAVLFWSALALGCVYFPMAFLAVAMFDTVAAVNPLLVVPSMLRAFGGYLVTVCLFAVALLASWAGDELLAFVLPVPILPGIISNFVGLYIAILEMRILGLLYFTHKHQLRWFSNRNSP